MGNLFLTDADYTKIAGALGVSIETITFLIALIFIWTLVWKGFALWKSARKGSPVWFVVFLLINTVGILPILYIYVFSKMKLDKINLKSKKPVKKVTKKKIISKKK